MKFSNEIIIRRPVAEVFAFISNLENVPSWNYAIVETRKASDGPVRVGTTYRQLRSIPTPTEETLEVTELEPARRFAVTGDLGPFHGTLTYELAETAEGTRLTNTAKLEASGLSRLAAPLARARVRDAVAENLATLKQLLERPTAGIVG